MRTACILAVLFMLAPAAPAADDVRVVEAFPALAFDRPVDLQDPRDGSARLFVVEQAGVVRWFANRPDASEAPVFLDLRAKVAFDGNEEGLLGLAFHPRFAENGFFYVNYTADAPLRTVIERYRADPEDPTRADPASGAVVLEVRQPYSNHNGGQTSFGPDGMLYVGMGDGGAGGDPHGYAQNPRALLGKMLRVDVDRAADGRMYGIPPDNPFANGRAARPEIYALGLRNPWRFSWDAAGRLWVADVGQNRFEEVHLVRAGGNYGWDVMEGSHCFEPPEGCERAGLEPPVAEYGRDEGGCVTGGFVYAGAAAPALAGAYVFGDFLSGRVWTLREEEPGRFARTLLLETGLHISTFGTDAAGELYFAAFDGRIRRFDA